MELQTNLRVEKIKKNNTNQLDGGQMFFPPEVFLVLRSHRRHHVVKVHDYVHHVVYQIRKRSVTA